MSQRTEAWLNPAPAGVAAELVPAASMLLQARIEIEEALADLTTEQLWARPGGAASAAYHLRHLAGSIDRLLTYAEGKQLDEVQLAALAAEQEPNPNLSRGFLVESATAAIERVLEALHDAKSKEWFDPREVGRSRLPSTVYELLYHIAEHTVRHTGQLITTCKIVRGL